MFFCLCVYLFSEFGFASFLLFISWRSFYSHNIFTINIEVGVLFGGAFLQHYIDSIVSLVRMTILAVLTVDLIKYCQVFVYFLFFFVTIGTDMRQNDHIKCNLQLPSLPWLILVVNLILLDSPLTRRPKRGYQLCSLCFFLQPLTELRSQASSWPCPFQVCHNNSVILIPLTPTS